MKRVLHALPRAGGVGRKLLAFLVLLIAAIIVLPFIVAKTPLRNILVASVLPNDAVRVTIREASLSWFSPPSLVGIEVKEPDGTALATVEKISLARAPLSLLLAPRDLGLIAIHRPVAHVQVRPDGSNVEDVANQLLVAFDSGGDSSSDTADSPPVKFAVQLDEGTVHIEDIAMNRRWRAERLTVQYDTRGPTNQLGRGAASGQMVELNPRGGEIPAGQFSLAIEPDATGREQLTFRADALSLTLLEPWLRRFALGAEVRGTLSGQGAAAWSAATSPLQIVTSGALAIDRLDATAAALHGDRIVLSRIELPWRLASQADGIAIDELQLRSEIGQAALRGRIDPSLAIERHDVELRGAIDLARLAAMLPRAMQIREGTTITSGTIELAGRIQPQENVQLVTGSVRTGQLTATNAGRPLRWDDPVNADFAIRRTASAMHIDTLRCESRFLRIDAAGSRQNFAASASFDLNSLAEQLGQFVDLSGVQLAGTGNARLAFQQTAPDSFTASASSELVQLVISLTDGAAWSEPHLTLSAEATGLLDPTSLAPTRVDAATLKINGQGDELDARLLAGVQLAQENPAWPVAVRANGRIARWLTRVRPWFAPDPWQIDGQTELNATLRIAADAFEASEAKLVVTNLRAASPGWNINEPRIELTGDARWNGSKQEFAASSAQLISSTISLASKDVRYVPGETGIAQLSGAAAFRTDLARLAAWQAADTGPPEYLPKGEFTGNLRFAQQGTRIVGDLTATGQNLALLSRVAPAPASNIVWQEPTLTLRGSANYDATADRVSFDQLQIQSSTLQANIAGQIQNVSTVADANLTGTMNYDLAQITPLLWPYLGNGIQLTGREQARFAVAGKLSDDGATKAQLAGVASSPNPSLPGRGISSATHWSRRVRAQLELPWSGANMYGLPVGAGRLAANLADGGLRIDPLSLAVGEGMLTATPNVRFDPAPAELTLPAGPLITKVRISPEVSETMLKFVAPVLAGATQSEGQFSLQLDGTRVPLDDPRRANAAGQLTVHSVRVSPGPMAREIVTVAQSVEALTKRRDPTALFGGSAKPVTLLTIRDQQVNFRVVDGRVHHQNLEFQVGDVTVRSQGSVGLDETVALTLQIPIQDAWITKEPLLAGLKGQSLQVPVAGTLKRPQLDQRAVANLSGQLLQNAAGQAIGGEVNKALDKLFKPR